MKKFASIDDFRIPNLWYETQTSPEKKSEIYNFHIDSYLVRASLIKDAVKLDFSNRCVLYGIDHTMRWLNEHRILEILCVAILPVNPTVLSNASIVAR